MKPSKRPAKRAVRTGSIEHKLMKLRERIDEKQTSEKKHLDLKWVDMHIRDTESGIVFGKGYMLKANDMWRKYA